MTSHSQQGFTLVEALVAFAILAMVLLATWRTAGTGLRAIDAAAANEAAVLAAQSEMDRIVALGRPPAERTGRIEGTPYTWEVEVLPADPAWTRQPLARKPVHLRLTLSWPSRTGTARVSLERVIFPGPARTP
jgi:prepilin-type N-terminal cleavage/methylation domain-containing protein